MGEVTLTARISDTLRICQRTASPRFLGFLSGEQTAQAIKIAKGQRVGFFGGYSGAQRCYFAAWPDWCDGDTSLFPITAITICYPKEYTLTHRDFLGSLMSLGITRECVGDILVESGRCVVFVSNEVVSHILGNVSKVGSVGVTLQIGYTDPLPEMSKLCDFSSTVASARLDCIVAELAATSRGIAAQLIEDSKVFLNGVCECKQTRTLNNGDSVSIRGKGRFNIVSVGEHSKKGRIILKYQKYM